MKGDASRRERREGRNAPAMPVLRADPANPERGEELTAEHLVRRDNRQVQDNHPASHRAWPDPSPSPISVSLIALVFASQLADGLGYRLAYGHGVEANPLAAAIGDPTVLLVAKIAAGLVMALGSVVLIRAGRERAVAWLACVGFVGALSEVAVLG